MMITSIEIYSQLHKVALLLNPLLELGNDMWNLTRFNLFNPGNNMIIHGHFFKEIYKYGKATEKV